MAHERPSDSDPADPAGPADPNPDSAPVPGSTAGAGSRPFRSPAQAAAVGLFRLSDRARRGLTEALRDEGMTLQQFNVLRILRGAGPDGLPTLTVGQRMVEQTPGVTRLLDRLESQGWVERRRDPRDRRRVVACITAAGRDRLAEVDEPFAEAEEAVFEGIPESEVAELARRLHAVLDETSRPGDRRTGRTPDGMAP